jgi:hypothetical protein
MSRPQERMSISMTPAGRALIESAAKAAGVPAGRTAGEFTRFLSANLSRLHVWPGVPWTRNSDRPESRRLVLARGYRR